MEGTKKTDLFHRSAHPKSLEFEKIGERQGRIEKKALSLHAVRKEPDEQLNNNCLIPQTNIL